jgi:hypothetical protein
MLFCCIKLLYCWDISSCCRAKNNQMERQNTLSLVTLDMHMSRFALHIYCAAFSGLITLNGGDRWRTTRRREEEAFYSKICNENNFLSN